MSEAPVTVPAARVGPLLAATLVSALLGWAALLAVAQLAGETAYATFAVMWAVYYALAGTLAGLQHEVTRSAVEPQEPEATGGLPMTAYAVGAGTGVLGLATFPLWSGSVSAGTPVGLALGAGLLGLAGLVIALGLLAAERRWVGVAGLLVADAVVRLVAVGAVAAVDGSTAWAMAAIGCASWVWVPGVLLLRSRGAFRTSASVEVARRRFGRRAVAAMLATGCGSLLIAGFPWLLAVTSRDPVTASAAGILAAVVLFRSPVLVLVYGLRPLILRDLLAHPAHAVRSVRRAWLGYLGLGVLGCLAGWVAGPALLTLTFGSGFEVTRLEAALLVVSAVLLAMATHGGLAYVAADAHVRSTQSWALAVAATLAALFLPLDTNDRVLVAAVAGPLAGLGWQALRLGGLSRSGQSSPSENADSRSWRE